MKLNPIALANAAAATAIALWLVCSFFVMALPGSMMSMTGHMLHADMAAKSWTLTLPGFVFGLLIWAAACWFTGWLIAVFYNRFAQASE